MTAEYAIRLQQAYSEVADTCDIETDRHKPWASTADAFLLNKVLGDINKKDRILDLGCCGYPWITNFCIVKDTMWLGLMLINRIRIITTWFVNLAYPSYPMTVKIFHLIEVLLI